MLHWKFETLYSGNSQYADTHISYRTIPIFIQFSSIKFSVSVYMCDRIDILLHTLLSVVIRQCGTERNTISLKTAAYTI